MSGAQGKSQVGWAGAVPGGVAMSVLPAAGTHLGTWNIPVAWAEWMWDFGYPKGHSFTCNFPLTYRVFSRNLGLSQAPCLILHMSGFCEGGAGRQGRAGCLLATHAALDNGLLSLLSLTL